MFRLKHMAMELSKLQQEQYKYQYQFNWEQLMQQTNKQIKNNSEEVARKKLDNVDNVQAVVPFENT